MENIQIQRKRTEHIYNLEYTFQNYYQTKRNKHSMFKIENNGKYDLVE